MDLRCPTLGHSNSNISKQIPQNHCQRTLMITNDTLRHDLNVPYVRDEIKKLSQKYADRLEKYPNIAIDLMSDAETPRGLKRKLSQDLCI